MRFIDTTEIIVKSGKGGGGMVSFRRARGKPKLGPDGGDGGFGGDVILSGESNLNTLATLRYRHMYRAEDGCSGGNNGKTGRCGEPKVIPVPLGTVVKDASSGIVLGEVTDNTHQLLVARGGKKGLGNMRFVSSTQQAPHKSTPGGSAEERLLKLELKLMADVGLAGLPNVGKSTLLSRLSAAKPEIADYPFTTLRPHLGVVEMGELGAFYGESFVMADIPGLIEGASEGRGLGVRFLRHLERTRLILFVVDGTEDKPETQVETLLGELKSYKEDLVHLSHKAVCISKADMIDADMRKRLFEDLRRFDLPVLFVSSVTGEGLDKLKLSLAQVLRQKD